MTQHFSQAHFHDVETKQAKEGKDTFPLENAAAKRVGIIRDFMLAALDNFQKNSNGQLPGQIVVYRDGVGGPQMKVLCKEREVIEISEAISKFAKNTIIKIVYIFVDKNTGVRILESFDGNGHIVNPGPGTCVDKGIVRRDGDSVFDFFMVSNNNPSSATAMPVHYDVVYNSSDITKEVIKEFTYHQAYGYFGFAGPIKVPATLKYAERLANYVKTVKFKGKNANDQPSNALSNYLHYI